MKLLYFAPGWHGSTSVQRFRAMAAQPGVTAIHVANGETVTRRRSLPERIMWKLRWPLDTQNENARLLQAAREHQPDCVFVEASKTILPETLHALRAMRPCVLAYYTPDDSLAPHNMSFPMRLCFPHWDVFFTTKSFNLAELSARGVRRPELIGKAYDPLLHRPLTREDVGAEYEAFDAVFIGTYEARRAASILALARAGIRPVIYGNNWPSVEAVRGLPNVMMRPAANAEAFGKAMHTGKIALNFLRKMNRDRITQRSVEIPAMQRVMVAERTEEHNAHFLDGKEYIGFSSDDELISAVRSLLAAPEHRAAIAAAGRARCIASGYATKDRAVAMLSILSAIRDARRETAA
jgi:spore maturation protein CgeB